MTVNADKFSNINTLSILLEFMIRDRPFNLKRGGGGYGFLFLSELFSMYEYLGNDHLTWRGWGYGFFSKKNILIPIVAE
jgi:hypothetical protein